MSTTLRRPTINRSPSVTHLRLARLHFWLARAILGGIAAQIFFAGLGLFSRLGFTAHAAFAPMLFVATLALPIIGHLAGLDRSLIVRSWALVGLMIVQGLLIDLGRWVWLPISSLHPLNALALAFIAFTLAQRSSRSQAH